MSKYIDDKEALELLQRASALVKHKGALYHINAAKSWLRSGLADAQGG